jgi:hypothetical protein
MVEGRSRLILDGHEIPVSWSVGGFQLVVADVTAGRFDQVAGVFRGVAGTAWLQLPCAVPPLYTLGVLDNPAASQLSQAVEVVAEVVHPQTEIAIQDAQRLQPDAQLGDTISVHLTVDPTDLREIVELGRGMAGWLGSAPHNAGFPVEFSDLSVSIETAGFGRVIDGHITYPIGAKIRFPIEIVIDGFTVVISSLELTPHRSTANAQVRLPGGMTDLGSCQPATIDLGTVTMSPNCAFYIDAPDQAYGPWLLADTGLVVEGTGYVLDLSTTTSPAPLPASWRGMMLGAGTASGEQFIPEPCNTGYLRGHFTYPAAVVVSSGFYGSLLLAEPVSFTAINPLGQTFTFDNGSMDVWQSKIAGGALTNGSTELLLDAVCVGQPGQPVIIALDSVSIQPDLDLTGVFDHGNREISWGELTNHGKEVVAWSGNFGPGYVYLPGGAYESYCPVSTGVFVGPVIGSAADTSLVELAAEHVAGVSFPGLSDVLVFSPDRPNGRANPIKLNHLHGWIRIGLIGVDGAVSTYDQAQTDLLGDPTGTGYVGKAPFQSTLFVNDKQSLLAEFVTSASFESDFSGRFDIPMPCNIARLAFDQMKLTSTACLVGGEVVLPVTGVPLQYWDLQLVPTGLPNQAGVVSVRTGRVLLTAAGIAESIHFAQPFGLTWAEMLADGNLGELDLDYNNWGQQFDGLGFNPRELTVSTFDPLVTDPYLGVFGPISFPFFGLHPVNIRDAINATSTSTPNPRMVTVPKTPITPHAQPTELALSGTWQDVHSNDLAVFQCPESDVDYNVPGQYGFQGTGTGVLSFLHSDPLDITVEIDRDATDIHLSSSETHDIDVGLLARLGGLAQIDGCARIEGPTLARITLYGMLEESAASGSLLGPRVGYETEIDIAVTPTTFDFYASGDMLLSVLVDLNVSATAHLLVDFAAGSAEGDFDGRVDCDAAVAGLTGQGQLTWYVGPTMQYLQGRLQVGVISLNSGALEGGFFIGNNVPKELAWVLDPTDTHFGMSRSILPPILTGVYGYGQASISVSYWVIGGGVDIFAGAGAFSAPLAAGGPVAPFAGNPLLPYVAGACGIYVHGEILGGLVSASAWANLSLRGPVPTYFEGTFGLQGCVAWVLCASVEITAGINSSGFYASES